MKKGKPLDKNISSKILLLKKKLYELGDKKTSESLKIKEEIKRLRKMIALKIKV